MSERGDAEGDQRHVLSCLLDGAGRSLQDAIEEHLEARRFNIAQRIIRWMSFSGSEHSDSAQRRLDSEIDVVKRKLLREMDEVRTKIEVATGRGHLSESERSGYDAVLVEMEGRARSKQTPEFEREGIRLESIESGIERALENQRKRTKRLLADLDLDSKSSEYMEVSEAIEDGDILTANELIDQVRGVEVYYSVEQDHDAARRVFERFYPSGCDSIDAAIEELPAPKAKTVVDRVVKGHRLGSLELSQVPGAQRQSAKSMLQAWYRLKLAGRLNAGAEESISTLLSELGFSIRQVGVTRSDRNVGEATVETDPVRARERCPIPAFGSFANGSYRIVCLWGRPTEEDILQHAEERTRTQATVVLYFGRLTKSRRASLASRSRERSQTLLMIDELLIVFLCGERDSRMPTLFACSIPFTYVQPLYHDRRIGPPGNVLRPKARDAGHRGSERLLLYLRRAATRKDSASSSSRTYLAPSKSR